MENIVTVIMAGGKGERFWPFSRRHRPKQLLPLVSDNPLLVETIDRVLPITDYSRTLVVANRLLEKKILEFLPELPDENLLAEPVGRDTAPCLAFAAHVVRKRFGPDAIMIVLSADQHIEHVDTFREVLKTGIEVAKAGYLTAIGVEPTRAETGFGYLHLGEKQPKFGEIVYKVQKFTEKPDALSAERMYICGDYLWNAGMFCWKTQRFLDELAERLPEVSEPFEQLDEVIDTPEMDKTLDKIFQEVPKISVDFGMMEKAKDVMTVAARGIEWDDLGSWQVLERMHKPDEYGNVGQAKKICIDTENSIIDAKEGLIVTIGVKDLLIVRHDDVVLVAKKNCSKELREVVRQLENVEELKEYL